MSELPELSFPRRRESSVFNYFWILAFARMTLRNVRMTSVGKLIIFLGLGIILSSCATQPTNPEAAGLNTKLGYTYMQQGDMRQAKSKFLLALQQDPKNPLVLEAMGYFLAQTGEVKIAENYYQQALAIAPEKGAVQNNYGDFLCRQGQYQEAIKHFVLATQDIDYLYVPQAFENASSCALKIPDKKLARSYLQKALQSDPNNKEIKQKLLKL